MTKHRRRQGNFLHLVSSSHTVAQPSRPDDHLEDQWPRDQEGKLPPAVCIINAALAEFELILQARSMPERLRSLNRFGQSCAFIARITWQPEEIEQIRVPLEAMYRRAEQTHDKALMQFLSYARLNYANQKG